MGQDPMQQPTEAEFAVIEEKREREALFHRTIAPSRNGRLLGVFMCDLGRGDSGSGGGE